MRISSLVCLVLLITCSSQRNRRHECLREDSCPSLENLWFCRDFTLWLKLWIQREQNIRGCGYVEELRDDIQTVASAEEKGKGKRPFVPLGHEGPGEQQFYLYNQFNRHRLRGRSMLLFRRIAERMAQWWKIHSL